MKIAIYHNLKTGGALSLVENLCKEFSRKKHSIEIFTTSESHKLKKMENRIYKINITTNSINQIFSFLPNLISINKKIAMDIESKKFDLILIFPCLHTQSPSIIRYIKNTKTIYIFTEPKREFYEQTTYDHTSIKRIIGRIIRLPIKFIDRQNCKKAKNIIAISHYSSYLLKKIYNQKSYVVLPGIKQIKPQKRKYVNDHTFISIGQISKIKGHDFSINQLSKSKTKVRQFTIIGRETYEKPYMANIIKNKKNISMIHTENEEYKIKLLKMSSFYLANQISEPFGLATLEGIASGIFILGKNEGGNPEIIRNGIGGLLYPKNHATQFLDEINSKKHITVYKNAIINWKETADKILKIANHL